MEFLVLLIAIVLWLTWYCVSPYILYPSKIKCNINAKGDRIYHMPGDKMYHLVKIDKSKGEMYVVTETEALENDFRRSKVR